MRARPNLGARNLPPNPTSQKSAENPYQSITFDELQNHPGATFDQRLIALTIDILILTLVGKAFDGVLEYLTIDDDGLRVVLLVLYFVGLQWWYGFTVGKYFVGLRLIGEGERSLSSFSRIFFRETAGKVLSLLPLGAGFFAVIFNKERLAWHDRLAQTKIISLKETQSSIGQQFVRGGLAILILLVVAAGFGGFTVLMTPVPLENLQQRLTWAGIHLSGVDGSLLHGYSIRKIHWQRDGNRVALENIQVRIDPWSFLAGRGNLHIRSLELQGGEINVVGDSVVHDEGASEGLAEEASEPSILTSLARSIRIDSFDVSNLKIVWGKAEVTLDRFFIGELQANLDEFKVARMYLDTSKAQFDVSDFKLHKGMIEMSSPLQGSLKAGLAPDLLKSDLLFTVKAWGPRDRPDFELTLFNSQVKVSRQEKKTTLEISDWSPVNYFKDYWPISSLNLKSEGVYEDSWDLTSFNLSGDFRILPVQLKVSEGQTIASAIQDGLKVENWQNGEKTTFTMKPHFFHDKSIWLHPSKDGQAVALPEALARTRGAPTMAELSESEQALVRRDVAFFSKSFLGIEHLIESPHKGREPAGIKSAVLPDYALSEELHDSDIDGPVREGASNIDYRIDAHPSEGLSAADPSAEDQSAEESVVGDQPINDKSVEPHSNAHLATDPASTAKSSNSDPTTRDPASVDHSTQDSPAIESPVDQNPIENEDEP